MTVDRPKVIYERSRLTFIADRIEPLGPEDAFRVVTPHGVFQMTKQEFYSDFQNVVRSRSYRTGTAAANHSGGYYHYYKVPRRAYKYRIDKKAVPQKKTRSLVFARPVSETERRFLEGGSDSPEPLVRKRCQILLESMRGRTAREIAFNNDYSYQTVRTTIVGFNEEGLSSIWRYTNEPRTSLSQPNTG